MPGSDRIGCQPAGYAICAAPPDSELVRQVRGGGDGRSQANACGWLCASGVADAEGAGLLLDPPPQPAAAKAVVASKAAPIARRDPRLNLALGRAIGWRVDMSTRFRQRAPERIGDFAGHGHRFPAGDAAQTGSGCGTPMVTSSVREATPSLLKIFLR